MNTINIELQFKILTCCGSTDVIEQRTETPFRISKKIFIKIPPYIILHFRIMLIEPF